MFIVTDITGQIPRNWSSRAAKNIKKGVYRLPLKEARLKSYFLLYQLNGTWKWKIAVFMGVNLSYKQAEPVRSAYYSLVMLDYRWGGTEFL